MYVIHEPDSLFAAALIVKYSAYSFDIVFTNRHDINYDITDAADDPGQYEKIVIIGPALNEYSIKYLERTAKEIVYIGSTNRLKEFMPEFYTENQVRRGSSVYYPENDCITCHRCGIETEP